MTRSGRRALRSAWSRFTPAAENSHKTPIPSLHTLLPADISNPCPLLSPLKPGVANGRYADTFHDWDSQYTRAAGVHPRDIALPGDPVLFSPLSRQGQRGP